jgi:histone acetyltransferase SAS3
MKMAAAVLLEEELQHSLATSEEDAEFEEDDELAADVMDATADAYAANDQLQNGMLEDQSEGVDSEDQGEQEEDDLSDEDAEGEDDDLVDPDALPEDEEGEDDEDEDEDEEGVGAVKIQPRRKVDDDEDVISGSEEEEESVASADDDDESKDSTDAEVEVQWEPAPEEGDEEEIANPNRCMYVVPISAAIFAANTFADFVNRMKKMTQVKNSSST